MMMNNLRENSVGLFDTRSPNPMEWRKLGVIKDPLWKGVYPNPFHMGFSHDSKKGYVSGMGGRAGRAGRVRGLLGGASARSTRGARP
jgi:hypothetical protein